MLGQSGTRKGCGSGAIVNSMRYRITIQTPSDSKTAYGNETQEWSQLAVVYAAIDEGAGRERFEADKETAFNRVKFTVRYRSDITPRERISFETKFFDILGTARIGNNEFLEITCELRQ